MQEMQEFGAQSLGQEDRATHSSRLAGKISWTEEPDGLKQLDMTEHTHTRMNKDQWMSFKIIQINSINMNPIIMSFPISLKCFNSNQWAM